MPHVDFPFSIERFLKFVSKIAKFSGRAKRARNFLDLSRSPEQSPTRSGSEYKGGSPAKGGSLTLNSPDLGDGVVYTSGTVCLRLNLRR